MSNLPLSTEAFNQLQYVESIIEHFPLTDQQDIWNSIRGTFSPSRAYKFLIGHRKVHQAYKWLWSCFCQPKHKVFFWLLLKDRLSTRDILRRKNMQLESYNCVRCSLNTEETSNHLFLSCPFAKECWNSISISFQSNITSTETVLEIRAQSNNRFFMISAILMSRAIWTVRNDLSFKNL
jgi:hypothetical protein